MEHTLSLRTHNGLCRGEDRGLPDFCSLAALHVGARALKCFEEVTSAFFQVQQGEPVNSMCGCDQAINLFRKRSAKRVNFKGEMQGDELPHFTVH
jgi:hypothetical protein